MTTPPRSGQRCPEVDISPPNRMDRWLLRRMLDAMGHPPIGFVLWNGEEIRGSQSERPRLRVLFSRQGREAQGWLPWTRDDLYVDG